MMICPKCHTTFEMPANFCPHCGVSLQRGGGRILIVTAALVLALIIGAYGYVKYQLSQGRDAARPSSVSPPQDAPTDRRATERRQENTQALADQPPPITTAELTLIDISGREILKAPIAVLSPGWFAFPMQPCIGGYTWQITLASGDVIEVEGGILHDAAPVGLWQLPMRTVPVELELMPWTPDRPLTWHSLTDEQGGQRVQVRNATNLVDFVRIPFQSNEALPGVFVQNGHVVGWSFSSLIEEGFLWIGNRSAELASEFYITDFYRLTFAGGREEGFLLALADESLSDLQRLEALAAAYQLEPRLGPVETPGHIRPAAIQTIMHELIMTYSDPDGAEDILSVFDARTVLIVNDPNLTYDLLNIAQDIGAYPYALDLISTLKEADGGQPEHLQKLQATLYREWLNRLLAEGDQYATRQIYREATDRFPQDPAIHLAGVELALQEQNWALAERLLRAQNYPPGLRDTVSRLQQEISERKSQEGKIVIRFRPGSRSIPVVARLDSGLNQHFLIDTGASLVTVPTATAQRLGIDLSYGQPRRLFYSATGVQHAVEVSLPYIELNGWVIENVKALVVDLPGKPEFGLLGMNYLGNFRMDVNTSEGMLLMEPR